ncbi:MULTISPECIES: hypothetical protein [Bacillus cereus group]|uniref:hypothetical protein n=1 Tax=Bacillus cereus group TaxID=86661 RepID=UPI0035CB4F0F
MKSEKRIPFYEIASIKKAHSLKTFDGKTYELKGAVAIENKTGEIQNLAQIYYQVRSIVDSKKNLIAKRKNQDSELVAVKMNIK